MKQKIIALFLLVTIIVVGGLMLGKSQEAMTGAQSILRTALSDALGSSVTVGQVEITSYNTITIQNMTIYDKQAEALAASEKITVTYSLLSLLRGQAVVDAISDVKVDKPTLWLTQASDGRWNIQDLLNQENTTKISFSGKVKLLDGTAILKTSNAMWTLDNINGSVDFANQPSIDLQVQAIHKGATVTAKGIISHQGRSTVTVTASELLVADYQILVTDGPLELVGGSVKNLEVTVVQKQGSIEWVGAANLVGVDMDVDGMPVRQIQGHLSFTNKKIYVFTTAQLLDQPIDVRGSIPTDTSEPTLDLTVSSAAFDPSVITTNIPLNGKVAFKAHVTGLAASPIIDGDVTLATGQVAGYEIKNAQAQVLMIGKNLTINSFNADMLGGHLIVTGTCQPETSSYQLHLTAQQIDIGSVADSVSGIGHGDVDVMIKGTGSFAEADVQGTVAIGQGALSGVAFSSLGTQFYRHNGIIDIDYANISLAEGLVTSSGVIDHQNINLAVYGQNIPLQQLDRASTGKVSGHGNFAGQITGTLSDPEFTGSFTAINGQVLSQPFAQAKGTMHVNRQQLVLHDLEIIDGVTKHQVQGTLGLDGQQEMNIMVKTHQARAENLVKLLAPGERLTGNVDNEMTLTGPLENFNAEGQILLTDGSFRGQLISKIQGFYKRHLGTTTMSQFMIDSLNTQIKLAGTISPDNELNFDMIAQDIDVERLNLKLPYPAIGRAQFTGKLTGTLNDPVFRGSLSATSLTFNGQEITGLTGEVIYNGNEIEIPYVSFMQGTGKFAFAGGFSISANEIYGSLDVENAELQPILAALAVPNKEIQGHLNGHVKLGGTLTRPNIWLKGTLKEGSIKKYPLELITLDVALENNVLTINDLSGTQGLGRLMARGTADLDGPLALEVAGNDIDAGLVATLLNTTVEPSGKMNFAAQISGVASNPHAAISLEVINGGIGTATFDSLYGLLIVDNNTIHVNQVLLKKGPYQASAYGTIPVAALSPTGRSQANIADQMDLKLRLDQANLSILPFLTKEVAWAEGPTQGQINVAGTLEQPMITGNITVSNGVVKLASLKRPIQKVGVDISFEGDTINIKQFDGYMGKGSYSVIGTAKIRGIALSDYDVSLVLNKPEIQSKYFTGAIDGNLNITNKGNIPKLSGRLFFENDIIDIPAIPDMVTSNLNIALDVELRAGKKVRFYNPYLYDILAVGRVKFAGSTLVPNVSGGMVATRGTINYLGTRFKITEGSVQFKEFASFEPTIKLKAETKIQQREVNLTVNGPMREMQFDLTSEPAMNQQEIISLLTLRSNYVEGNNSGIGRDEVVSIVGAGLQLQFISEVEDKFRTVLGLDEFRLVKDTTSTIIKKSYSDHEESTTVSQEVYNIEMSKYLTDKILVSYTMGLDHDKSDLALRYTLNRHTSLTASVDEQQRTWFGFETRYRF